MLKNKICALLILSILCLLVWRILSPKHDKISFSGIGVEYSISDSKYNKSYNVTFKGEYSKSIVSSDKFVGQLYIDGMEDLKKNDIVSITFSNSVGTPRFESTSGMEHITPVHSIFLDLEAQYAVIFLYSQYENSDGVARGVFNLNEAKFICLGEISRSSAVALISKIYS